MKCTVWNNSANWGIVEQHRHGIIMPNLLALLHMCLLVGKDPPIVFAWRLVALSLWQHLWQHLWNIAIAPGLWLLFLSGCTGQGECRDGGSLCVRSLFTKGSLYAGSHATAAASCRSRSAAGCVGVSCSPCSCPRVTLLRRSKPLHEGGHSDGFLRVVKRHAEVKLWSWRMLWGRSLTEACHFLGWIPSLSQWNVHFLSFMKASSGKNHQ